MDNFQETFDPEAPCPEAMMPMNSEFESYRNVAIDYQPEDNVFKGACTLASNMMTPNLVAEYYPSQETYPEDDGRFFVLPDHKISTSVGDSSVDLDLMSCFDLSASPVYVPQPPIVVLATSFKCHKTSDSIVDSVKQVFEKLGVSFEFAPSVAEFNAVFVKGATYTKFQVHVYDDSGNHGFGLGEEQDYIVEAQRLCGDGFAFNSIFGEIRSALCTDEVSCPSSSSGSPRTECSSRSSRSSSLSYSGSFSSSPSASLEEHHAQVSPLTEDEKTLFVEPIVRMTQPEAAVEAQLEGCRLLCDMIVSNAGFHEQLCSCGVVESLMRLCRSDSFLTCQHAVIALAELSSTPSCLQAIWERVCSAQRGGEGEGAGFVEFLCSQFVDGPYFSEAKRRQSALLLTNMLEYLTAQRALAGGDNCSCSPSVLAEAKGHLDAVSERVLSPRLSPAPDVAAGSAQPLQDSVLENCIARLQLVLQNETRS